MKKIGFVIPWYGDNIPGGAEADLRGIVKHLTARGVDLEVLTTCVKEFAANWSKNYHKEGITEEGGITVRRFPVRQRDRIAFDRINHRLMQGQYKITLKDEETFLREMVNSPALYDYIRDNKDEYSVFVFTPYMFGTTYYGVQACYEKALMIPCFHDEPYAYFEKFSNVYSRVRGMAFHAKPEFNLINGIYDLKNVECRIIGDGMETDLTHDEKRFREKYKADYPFILYAGRKDKGKNIYTLIDYFRELKYRKRDGIYKDLKLVLIGGGEVNIPEDAKNDIIDLGFVPKQDKYDAYSAAAFTCQPSKNESFSLVIMESWLCGRPVMVCEECAVTTNFAKESRGGLFFKDYYDFEAATNFLLTDERADEMAQNGRDYVLSHFKWDTIIDLYYDFIVDIAKNNDRSVKDVRNRS
ncbi:MAG TPA: hexosyltransferase [Lachnospiraceae bacterium]|nr:hexosyltransferase [Lachnospiraceae bacterium]